MKSIQSTCLSFGLALCLLFQLPSALSATIQASATVELNSITLGAGVDYFEFEGTDFFEFFALVNEFSAGFEEDYYASTAAGGASAFTGLGSGSASAEGYGGQTYSQTQAVAQTSGDASAIGFSELGYAADGIGEVNLSFGVYLNSEISGASGGEFAQASASISDSAGGFDLFDVVLDGNWDDDILSDSFILDWIINVDGYTTGLLTLETSAVVDTGVTTVPVPAALWLFLSACLGLFGLTRAKAER